MIGIACCNTKFITNCGTNLCKLGKLQDNHTNPDKNEKKLLEKDKKLFVCGAVDLPTHFHRVEFSYKYCK